MAWDHKTPPIRRLLLVLSVTGGSVLLTTCSVDKLLKPPAGGILQVTPTRLEDSAAVGSLAARVMSLQISNGASGTLGWTAAVEEANPWLRLAAPSGNAPGTLAVSAAPTGLGVGVYRDTIVVAAMTGGGEARIPVQFTVHPCSIQPLAINSELSGALGSVDCGAPHRDSSFADLYRFLGSAGDSVSIELAATKFAPYLILDTTATPPAAAGVPLPTGTGCAGLPGTTCLRYQRLPRSGTFILEAATVSRHDSGSYTVRLFRPRAPQAPESLEQFGADSVTVVATGGVSVEPAVVLSGVVRDPDAGDSLRLEVELRPVGAAFTGAATAASAQVAADEEALVLVTGLTDNTSYHWRARTLDQTGRVSAWSSYGANAEVAPDFLVAVPDAPAVPAGPGQFKSDALTAIAVGGQTDEATMVLKGTVFDQDPGDRVRLEVEVRPLGTAFTGEPTASSPLETSGSIAAVTIVGLANQTDYHWQTRAVDQGGLAGAWSSYGGNSEGEVDFRVAVARAPNAPTSLTQLRIDGATLIDVGDTIPERSLYFRGGLSDPDPGDQVRFEVELKPVGVNFTNVPSGSSVPVPSGSTASVALTGLADNASYHWQARAVDQTGRAGPWTAFGANLETSHDFYIRVPPSRLVFTVQPTTVVSNVAIAPAVIVSAQDMNGATITSFTGEVTIALGSGPAGAVLSGTTAVAAVAGVATFSDLRIDRSGSAYTLVATSPGLAPVTSSSFVVTAGPAAKLVITTPPGTTAQSGVPLSPQPVVRIQDAAGNNVSQGGTVITAAIASGGGTLGGTLTPSTNSSGVASFTDLKITGAVGTRALRFTSPGLTAVTSSAINLTAGPASTMDVNAGNGQSAAAGTAVAVAPSVIVRDASGNPVSGVAVTFVAPPRVRPTAPSRAGRRRPTPPGSPKPAAGRSAPSSGPIRSRPHRRC